VVSFIDPLIAFVSAHAWLAYLTLFLAALLEAVPIVGSVVPGSTIILALSALVPGGELRLEWVLAAAVAVNTSNPMPTTRTRSAENRDRFGAAPDVCCSVAHTRRLSPGGQEVGRTERNSSIPFSEIGSSPDSSRKRFIGCPQRSRAFL